jgi:hypothetical protein
MGGMPLNDTAELWELEQRALRVYGPARLSRGARALMWLLRIYVVAMLALVVFAFTRQLG